MPIDEYFQQIQTLITSYSVVTTFTFYSEKRGTHEGLLRAEIQFANASVLHVREYVSVEVNIIREMYVYQYMNASKILIFRYDNTPHHRKLNLLTYPHHKHDGDDKNVICSPAPSLAEVLLEITEIMGNYV